MACDAWGRVIWLACWVWFITAPMAIAAPGVTMFYYERKPFHYTDANGQPAGLIIGPTTQAFEKAGIPVTWKVMPASRILVTLKANVGDDCSPGWYKTTEREQYVHYSLPIYNDKPLVAIVRADYPLKPGMTAKEFFLHSQVKLITKQSFVHGAYLDQIIGAMPQANVVRVPDDISSIVRMLHYGMGDVVTATQEEAEYYVTDAGYKMNEFHIITFPDVPAVEKRYVLCSKRVSNDVMDKLNAVIRTMTSTSAHAP
jgi:polar amino acid transport system substrate-binding protein